MNIRDIAKIIHGELIARSPENLAIKYLSIDSRSVIPNESSLFFAIKGERHDGHQYIAELIGRGVKNFIVDDLSKDFLVKTKSNPANIIKVKNVKKALQALAKYKRGLFQYPVIGVTGSNGKTIIKEWTANLLSNKFTVVKSPKSYNSQYGVPLSVWQMSAKDEIAIIEAGISTTGEMQNLETIIKPTIGVLANIGSAHDSGFESHEQKLQEKLKLFQHTPLVFYNGDDPLIAKFYTGKHNKKSVGFQSHHDFYFTYSPDNKTLSLQCTGEKYEFNIPYHDTISLKNLIFCIAIAIHLEVPLEELKLSIARLPKVSMRLELKSGLNGCYLIDDSYNNDLEGFRQALDFLGQQSQRKQKSLIISDIAQGGVDQTKLYEAVGQLIEAAKLKNVICIGENIEAHKKQLPSYAKFFKSTSAFLADDGWQEFEKEAILVKGARVFHFEKIIQRLQQKEHGTIMEVDLNSMIANLNYFRSKIKEGTNILVMIKAFAYGSGFLEIANMLQNQRVDYLGVAYPDEGVVLRQNGITLPIMVMNAHTGSFENLWRYRLEPEVYSMQMVKDLGQMAKVMNEPLRIHIKVETGMNRLGFEEAELEELTGFLINHPLLEVASIFSHMASADLEAHDEYNFKQLDIFNRCYKTLSSILKVRPMRHILKTSGILRFPDHQMEMVRLGIGLHGYAHNEESSSYLIPSATLKTSISMIKQLRAGDAVGYNRMGEISKHTRIATLRIGYADGYDRRFSNGVGKVLIKGHLAPVVGNVCMDMCMVDVTAIDCAIGDEVVIFGKELSLVAVAESIGTIPYEILCKVSPRVKRVFYAEI